MQLIINIEAQKSDRTSYPLIKRAIYYASRMISAQKNKAFIHSHYEKICKVYSIWIQMNVGADKANTITRYRIAEEQVIGNVQEKESNYDLLTVIMMGLGAAEKAEDKSILRLLDVLLSAETKPEEKKAILEKDFNISMTAEMSEEANIMCNLGEGIRERAEIKTKVDDIVRVSRAMNVSIEHAMEILGIDQSKVTVFKELIDNQLAAQV